MAKQAGLNDRLFVHGVDLSGDINAISAIAAPKALMDVPNLAKSAMERICGLADGRMQFRAWFNPEALASHPVLTAIPATDICLLYMRGATLGGACAALTAKQWNHASQRGADGSLAAEVNASASVGVGLEWGESLTAGQVVHASADAEVGLVTAQTTAGGVGFLQVQSLGSGSPSYLIEDSSDTTDGINGSWGTLLTFTGGAAPFGERKTVTGTVEKGIRATTTGTFANAAFAMGFRRGTAQDVESLA